MIAPAVLLSLLLTGAPDVPDSILASVAYRETAAIWRGHIIDPGDTWRGSDTSPWQLSAAVLQDLHADRQRARQDFKYAEGLARRWLAHLYRICGTWPRAISAYHVGLRKADTARGRAYAGDVLALSALYVP